jgi:hypothetical protein
LLPTLTALHEPASKQQEKTAGRDIYGRPLKGNASDVATGILGCWQLVDIDDADLPAFGRTQAGFLLITEDFLALEIHVAWEEEGEAVVDEDFQSGIHEYHLDATGRLVTTGLIGAFLHPEDYELTWEPPAEQRRFYVDLAGSVLSLRRDDGSRLSFNRRRPSGRGSKDIYGREIVEKDSSEGE